MVEEAITHSTIVAKTFPVKPKLKPKPKNSSKTPESKYWGSFKSSQIQNLIYSVPSIAFSPTESHQFAASVSTSITVYSSKTLERTTSITSFKDVVSCCSFRCDGSLLAASDLTGLVQVFNVKTRAALRHLRSHSRPVRFVHYPKTDKVHLISGGDDALVKYWDITGESVLQNFTGHKDYIRCGDWSPASEGIFVSGSYDHTVKLWDARIEGNKSIIDANHGKPIEDVLFLPSGGMVATSGGNCVKIWDVIGGGRLVYTMESHNKTVTSMCIGKFEKEMEEENRLFSVGLDGYLKIFDFGRMKMVHTARYPAPLMSVEVSPDSKAIVIGTSNGSIVVGKRKVKVDGLEMGDIGEGSLKGLGRRVPTFSEGNMVKAKEGSFLVKKVKKVKIAEHDKLLKKFRHKEALITVVKGKNPEKVVAVIEELIARRKLVKCVMNLDEDDLNMLMGFLQKYLTVPRHSRILMGLTQKVLQLMMDDIKASHTLRLQILNIRRSLNEEIRLQQALQEIQGILSPLLRIAARK